MSTRVWTEMQSPVGPLTLVAEDGALAAIDFGPAAVASSTAGAPRDDADAALAEARRQLESYFAGKRRTFSLPLSPRGTPFQRRVWTALEAIPYGETASYGEIAAAIGAPGSARAVGAANGANPLPIVIPCHRVIGADGSLTGYGGGMERKKRLLALEAKVAGLFADLRPDA